MTKKELNSMEVGNVYMMKMASEDLTFVAIVDEWTHQGPRLSDLWTSDEELEDANWIITESFLGDYELIEFLFHHESPEERLKKLRPELFL
jgi:hypothetical protein